MNKNVDNLETVEINNFMKKLFFLYLIYFYILYMHNLKLEMIYRKYTR